jgi:chromosome partitioning protein
MCAATAVLVTVHPQMLDVMSMCQCPIMTSDLLGGVAKAGGKMGLRLDAASRHSL